MAGNNKIDDPEFKEDSQNSEYVDNVVISELVNNYDSEHGQHELDHENSTISEKHQIEIVSIDELEKELLQQSTKNFQEKSIIPTLGNPIDDVQSRQLSESTMNPTTYDGSTAEDRVNLASEFHAAIGDSSDKDWVRVLDLGDTENSLNPWKENTSDRNLNYDVETIALEVGIDVSGIIQFDDGSQVAFDNIECIEW
ncbi:MAG: hypothetical protein R8G33_07800 [Gammaproteobacteria bacterium]|nr:hypothetical protein [Gammaproteobacteria bacterium]